MKRIILFSLTAIITFILGIIGSWLFILATLLPNISTLKLTKPEYPVSPQFDTAPPAPEPFEGTISVEYAWTLMGRDARTGIFRVTNSGQQSIYYPGFKKHDNQRTWIRQSGKTKANRVPASDGTDEIEEQELKPNESENFWIDIPDNNKPFEAGFTFKYGNQDGLKAKTRWVKVIKQIESYGLTCNQEIVAKSNVLADTCLK